MLNFVGMSYHNLVEQPFLRHASACVSRDRVSGAKANLTSQYAAEDDVEHGEQQAQQASASAGHRTGIYGFNCKMYTFFENDDVLQHNDGVCQQRVFSKLHRAAHPAHPFEALTLSLTCTNKAHGVSIYGLLHAI
jgi:hypothetical protein